MAFSLRSPAFQNGQPIPVKYTCQGSNISHALTWSDPPPGTQSFVLINDDPDDGPTPWVHWLVYNIPGSRRGLPENVPLRDDLEDGTLQGTNSFGKLGYGGPCPPTGVHRYVFTLYALNATLPLPAKVKREELEMAIKGRILGQAQLMGTYIKE